MRERDAASRIEVRIGESGNDADSLRRCRRARDESDTRYRIAHRVQVARNVATPAEGGTVVMSKIAHLSKKVLDEEHLLGNHTFAHKLLPRLSE